jgi:hypothetical protein
MFLVIIAIVLFLIMSGAQPEKTAVETALNLT